MIEDDDESRRHGIVRFEPFLVTPPTTQPTQVTITTISPNSGNAAGGTAITITGNGFVDGSPAFRRGIAVLEGLLSAIVPEKTALLPNYPNPFNPETWIPYRLAQPAAVTIQIYDVQGRLIRTLALGQKPAGYYLSRDRTAYWDGRNESGEGVASGMYIYQLVTPNFQQTRRLVVVK